MKIESEEKEAQDEIRKDSHVYRGHYHLPGIP